MTEEPDETGEETEEEQSTEPVHPTGPQRPPTVVEIKTPLDRPEFDWFLDTFMTRMGLQDRKQSAIMLSNMLYDMGLDPTSDLKDIQSAMQEMNSMLKNLPDSPTAARVKDTMSGMYAAKVGRTMLERFPKVTNQDPMMERMEKLMDKYMPMILSMRMVSDMMKNDISQTGQQRPQTFTEIPEVVKTELAELRSAVTNMSGLLSAQKATEEQKQHDQDLIATVTTTINATLIPQLQTLQAQVDALAKQPASPNAVGRSEEMRELSLQLKNAIDQMGEKAGQKSLTLADIDPLLQIIDKVEGRLKKEPTGDFDWRVEGMNTVGEIGKELVTAYRDVQTAKANSLPSGGGQPACPAPMNPQMQEIIKKQVQNYILGRLKTGAIEMNISEAARTLGLTAEQVNWAYQTLVTEGWITTRAPPAEPKPAAEQKPTGAGEQNVGQTRQPAAAQQPFIET